MSGHEIIKEHKYLLDKMKKDRIFSLCFENNKFYLDEQCDNYFSHELTKEDCIELSKMFDEIANAILE